MRVLLALSLCRTKSGGPARCPTETIGLPQSLWAAVGMREGFPSVATAWFGRPYGRHPAGAGEEAPEQCRQLLVRWGHLKPDLITYSQNSGQAIVWDLTAREDPAHFKKTILYQRVLYQAAVG